jgi:hypothetical protein
MTEQKVYVVYGYKVDSESMLILNIYDVERKAIEEFNKLKEHPMEGIDNYDYSEWDVN